MLFLTNFAKFTVFPAFTKRTMALLAATTVLAYQTYKGYKSYQMCKLHNEKQKRLMEEQEAAFENRYFKEFDQMNDDPDAAVPSTNSHVRETTPQGDVIMTYDVERALFCYYCDKRTVQFKYLEPVARKYVIEHGCKRLYIDFRKEMSKANEKASNPTAAAVSNPAAATNPPIAPPPVFAQLKKYSNGNNRNNGNNGNRIPNLSKINEFIKTKGLNASASASSNVLKEQVTHYLYCGRVDDFVDASESSPTNETHDFNIIKPIDYASYKKMNDAL